MYVLDYVNFFFFRWEVDSFPSCFVLRNETVCLMFNEVAYLSCNYIRFPHLGKEVEGATCLNLF